MTADPGVGSAAAVDVAVELTGVVKVFAAAAAVRVLDGVDLSVEPGEVVAVAGRSGSGKTTLLTIVAGWDAPDAGSVVVVGAQRAPHGPAWSEVAVVPQSLGLLEELTVPRTSRFPGASARTGPQGPGRQGPTRPP